MGLKMDVYMCISVSNVGIKVYSFKEKILFSCEQDHIRKRRSLMVYL